MTAVNSHIKKGQLPITSHLLFLLTQKRSF